MSGVDPNQLMYEGLDTLLSGFARSPLGQPLALQNAGLSRGLCSTGFRPWDGEGDFYGGSQVELCREDGAKFMWKLGVFYEQGSNDGEPWQHGCAYAYVAINLNQDEGRIAVYTIGDVQLPATPLKLADLPEFSRAIAGLAENCLEDLEYVYEAKLFVVF